MKKTLLLLLVLSIGAFGQTTLCQDWTGNINAFIGTKSMDEDDWEPVEDQGEIGFLLDFQQDNWPVAMAIDLLISSADEGDWYEFSDGEIYYLDMEAVTEELCIGLRKNWRTSSNVTPFFGGGAAVIYADIEAYVDGYRIDDDDIGFGLWIDGGVYWTIGEHFNIGLDIRFSGAEVTLLNEDFKAGGSHLGVLLGYHW